MAFECLSQRQLSGLPQLQADLQADLRFSEFTQRGGRPSLQSVRDELGPSVCDAMERGWAQEAHDRASASQLVDDFALAVQQVLPRFRVTTHIDNLHNLVHPDATQLIVCSRLTQWELKS